MNQIEEYFKDCETAEDFRDKIIELFKVDNDEGLPLIMTIQRLAHLGKGILIKFNWSHQLYPFYNYNEAKQSFDHIQNPGVSKATAMGLFESIEYFKIIG